MKKSTGYGSRMRRAVVVETIERADGRQRVGEGRGLRDETVPSDRVRLALLSVHGMAHLVHKYMMEHITLHGIQSYIWDM